MIKAIDTKTHRIVAIKYFKTAHRINGLDISCLRELTVLKQLRHKNIVQVYSMLNIADETLYVMEFFGSDLSTYMSKFPMTTHKAKYFLKQILSALAYCHERMIIHRDIKLQNVLVSSDDTIKLCDFGMARLESYSNAELTNDCFPDWFEPPEVYEMKPQQNKTNKEYYTEKTDIWQTSIVFYLMMHNNNYFMPGSSMDERQQVFSNIFSPTSIHSTIALLFPTVSIHGIEALVKMFTLKPANRASAKELLNSRWLTTDISDEIEFN